jgi:hypothetical protein
MQAPVATAQTLIPGDLVVLSSNQIAKASASVAAPLGVMAQTSTTQAAGTLVSFQPILPGQTWRMGASAAATSMVWGAGTYDITSAQLVDVADSTNGSILILRTIDSTTDVEVCFNKGVFF